MGVILEFSKETTLLNLQVEPAESLVNGFAVLNAHVNHVNYLGAVKIPHLRPFLSGPVRLGKFADVNIVGNTSADFTVGFIGDAHDADRWGAINLLEAVIDSLVVHDVTGTGEDHHDVAFGGPFFVPIEGSFCHPDVPSDLSGEHIESGTVERVSTDEGRDDSFMVGIGEIHVWHPLLLEFSELVVAFATGFSYHITGDIESSEAEAVVADGFKYGSVGVEIMAPSVFPIAGDFKFFNGFHSGGKTVDLQLTVACDHFHANCDEPAPFHEGPNDVGLSLVVGWGGVAFAD